MNRSRSHQKPLFDSHELRVPRVEKTPRPPPPPDEDFSKQMFLFEDRVVMIGELEQALRSADYRKALEVKDNLEQMYGASAVPPGLTYLERLGADFWERPIEPGERLSGWRTIARELDGGGRRFRRARNAFFRRLFSLESPDELIRCDPECVVPVANTLYDLEEPTEGGRAVRNALLLGCDIRPLDLEDEALSDLLSEDLPPRWLACLGGLRRIWPLPRPEPHEVAAFEREMRASAPLEPLEDDERALSFWRCLCVARLGSSVNERLLQEARKRMKRLNPELHAVHMEGSSSAELVIRAATENKKNASFQNRFQPDDRRPHAH